MVWLKRDKRNPVKGKYGEPTDWDGLSSLFVVLAARLPEALTQNDRAWLKSLAATHEPTAS